MLLRGLKFKDKFGYKFLTKQINMTTYFENLIVELHAYFSNQSDDIYYLIHKLIFYI